MMILPVQLTPDSYSLFVLLEDDNIERIKEYDPAEINIYKLTKPWSELKLLDVVVTYLAPADKDEFLRLCTMSNRREALKLVTRGFRYRPDKGDHDRGPESLLK